MGKQMQTSLLDKNLGTGESIPFYVQWPINFLRIGVVLVLYGISLAFAIIYFVQLVETAANPSIALSVKNFVPPGKEAKAKPQQFPAFTVCNLEADPVYTARQRSFRIQSTNCFHDTSVVCGADKNARSKHLQPEPVSLFACPDGPILIPPGFKGCKPADRSPLCAVHNNISTGTNSTTAPATRRRQPLAPARLRDRRAANLARTGNALLNSAPDSFDSFDTLAYRQRVQALLAAPATARPRLPTRKSRAAREQQPLVDRVLRTLDERQSATTTTTTTTSGSTSSSTGSTGTTTGSTTTGISSTSTSTSTTGSSGGFCRSDSDCSIGLADSLVLGLCGVGNQCVFPQCEPSDPFSCQQYFPGLELECRLNTDSSFVDIAANSYYCVYSSNSTSTDPCLSNPSLCGCTSDSDCSQGVCDPFTKDCTAGCSDSVPCSRASDQCINFRCTDVGRLNATSGLSTPCASDNDCFATDRCEQNVCVAKFRPRCIRDDMCPYGQTCTKGKCELQTCTVDDDCSWPNTVCHNGTTERFCAQKCKQSAACPFGYDCLPSVGSGVGGCFPSTSLPVFQLQSLLAAQCNASITYPNLTLGCMTFNEGGVFWAKGTGRDVALETTVIVPSPQVKLARLKGRDELTWVVDPYSPFGVGITFHRPGEYDRVQNRIYDDYAKPGLLTLQALSKTVSKYRVTAPKDADVNRWNVVHGELALPNLVNRDVESDVGGNPVRLTVYLHVFFDTLSYEVNSEVITYTIFNWFGDSTAVAGFLTGACLWGGVSLVQMFKRPIDLLL